jgi:hypothetical protein
MKSPATPRRAVRSRPAPQNLSRCQSRPNIPTGSTTRCPASGRWAPHLDRGPGAGPASANRTGRPFTGDWAGDLLYATLLKHGLAKGVYDERADDTLELVDCRIANSGALRAAAEQARTIRDQNLPPVPEIGIGDLAERQSDLGLGKIAHDSVCDTLGRAKRCTFQAWRGVTKNRQVHADLELSLLALQHQHRGADDRRCSKTWSARPGSWRFETLVIPRKRVAYGGIHVKQITTD